MSAVRSPTAPALASPSGPVLHGGNLAAARVRFPAAPEPWIDLSTGINPRAYPVGEVVADAWCRLPEPADLRVLEATAAVAYRAARPCQVVAAPGTQSLLQVLPRVVPARRVAVLGFTYQEHSAVWQASGAEIATVEEVDSLADADVAVVVNPNNPDGRRVDPLVLGELGRRMHARGGVLVVDEAFADVAEANTSLVPGLPSRGVVVLRSFGKFYGLAGLRLGFAVAGEDLAAALRAALGPWAVSGPAVAIGSRALADAAWRNSEGARLRADSARLDRLLGDAGFRIVGGTTLFRLVASQDAPRWFERLGAAGILVRPFPDRPAWLRFGLPGDEAAWARLVASLRS